MHPEKINILYVLGPGHCGSTLLNLAVDRHPQMLGLGELQGMNRKGPLHADAVNSPFWQAVGARYETTSLGESEGLGAFQDVVFHASNDWITNLLGGRAQPADWQRRNLGALKAIRAESGASILVDSSKSWARLQALLGCEGVSVKVVYLIRDGRAVANSYHRKYGNWVHGVRMVQKLEVAAMILRRLRVPKDAWLTLRYEDMAQDPEAALRRVCGFAGLPYDPAMLSPESAEYRGIGGNRMRKQPIRAIKLDEAWRRELPLRTRLVLSLACLNFNLRHGYRAFG
jgi:hypothetical protein